MKVKMMKSSLLLLIPIFLLAAAPVYAQQDIVLLNHRYNHADDKDSILGLVYNNSTSSYDRSDIEMLVVFYDKYGGIIDTIEPYIYPDTLKPWDYTHFKISFSDSNIRDRVGLYDILLDDVRVAHVNMTR